MLKEVKKISVYEIPKEWKTKSAHVVFDKQKNSFEFKDNYHPIDLAWSCPVEFLPEHIDYALVFQGKIVKIMGECDGGDPFLVLGPYYWDRLPLNLDIDKILCIDQGGVKKLLLVEHVSKSLPTLHMTTLKNLHKLIG